MFSLCNSDGVYFTSEVITPELANDLLSTNLNSQRPMKKTVVNRYAAAIMNDEWVNNGESIKIDCNNSLIDGQHRLRAIIKANKPVRMTVARNIDPRSFSSIDTGVSRTSSDNLKIMGFKNTNVLAASALDLLIIERGQRDFLDNKCRALYQNSDVADWVVNHSEIHEIVSRGSKWRGKSFIGPRIVNTIIGALSFFGDPSLLDYCVEFFQAIESGKESDSPAFVLRERLIQSKMLSSKSLTIRQKYALTITAWNQWATGTKKQTLVWRSFGKKAQGFPVIYGVDIEGY